METWGTQIRNLLFDYGGTLDVAGAHWLDRFLRLYQSNGIGLSREELDLAYAYATGLGYQAGERIYNYGLRQILDQLVDWQIDYMVERLPHRVPPSIRNVAANIAAGFHAESAAGYEQSRAALRALAARFKIGVVSNFYGNLEAVLNEAGLAPFVRATIDSSRVGAFKPDRAIYDAAIARLDARPHETLMIGDSLTKDCAPAHRIGLRTAWLLPASGEYTAPREGVDLIVRNLRELVEICLGVN